MADKEYSMTEAEYLTLSTFVYAAEFGIVEKNITIQGCVDNLRRKLKSGTEVSGGGMNKND